MAIINSVTYIIIELGNLDLILEMKISVFYMREISTFNNESKICTKNYYLKFISRVIFKHK